MIMARAVRGMALVKGNYTRGHGLQIGINRTLDSFCSCIMII